jgi:hypothetical protein
MPRRRAQGSRRPPGLRGLPRRALEAWADHASERACGRHRPASRGPPPRGPGTGTAQPLVCTLLLAPSQPWRRLEGEKPLPTVLGRVIVRDDSTGIEAMAHSAACSPSRPHAGIPPSGRIESLYGACASRSEASATGMTQDVSQTDFARRPRHPQPPATVAGLKRRGSPPGVVARPRRSVSVAGYRLPVVVDAIHGATVATREYMPYLSRRAHPSPQLTTPINVGRPSTRSDRGPPLSP